METLFIFSPIQDYFNKFKNIIQQDINFRVTEPISFPGCEEICCEWLVTERIGTIMYENGELAQGKLHPYFRFKKFNEDYEYHDIDVPPETLNSIKQQIDIKERLGLDYNYPELLEHIIKNLLHDELYINPISDKLYSVKYLKEQYKAGKKIYIHSENIFEQEDWDW